MEFTGEITKADGEVVPLYVTDDGYRMVAGYVNFHIRAMADGDSMTIARTK